MKKRFHISARPTVEYTLVATMVISFVTGAVLVGLSTYVGRNMSALVGGYLDPLVKQSNTTKTLLARYGAIVPDKDYIPMEIDLGPWLPWLPAKAFDMGVVLMAFSLFGMYAAVAGRRFHLYIVSYSLLYRMGRGTVR